MNGDIPHPQSTDRIHASCVAVSGRAVLITGASGTGKSALALNLMALGATLVADDQVDLSRDGARIIAQAPPAIHGLIEARFVGLLNAKTCAKAQVILAVTLDQVEEERLPPHRSKFFLGCAVPLLHNVGNTHFPAAILQYLRCGRSD